MLDRCHIRDAVNVLIESTKMSLESPPASHIAKPANPFDLMNAPFAVNERESSYETMTLDVELYTYGYSKSTIIHQQLSTQTTESTDHVLSGYTHHIPMLSHSSRFHQH